MDKLIKDLYLLNQIKSKSKFGESSDSFYKSYKPGVKCLPKFGQKKPNESRFGVKYENDF